MLAPSPSILLDRARAIADTLPDRMSRTNEQRELDTDLIADIKRADLFRLFRPRRFGGFEVSCTRSFF